MKKNLFILLIITLGILNTNIITSAQDTCKFRWTKEQVQQHLKNIEDSLTWDKKLLERDTKNTKRINSEPISFGAFPVPDYDLVGKGSFIGFGNYEELGSLKLKDKTLVYNSFFVNKSPVNEDYIIDKENEVFFTIIAITDFIDTSSQYSHFSSFVSSRNHPNYIGQGYFKTKNNRIDYVSFITADRSQFAIVNMRLFDLKNGNTILIAPQKDGSLRSKQIKSPKLSTEELKIYIEHYLIKQEEIINFFTKKGNI